MTRKKKLALLLACLTGTGMMSTAAAEEHPQTEAAEEMDTYGLPETTVIGLRRPADTAARRSLPGGFQAEQTNFGLMGDRDVMLVPYTAQSLTTKNFDTFSAPSGDVNQVLANVPSLRVGTSLIKTDFSARGMLANGSAMYLNNVPGFFIMASGPVTNTIGRADVMVGPAERFPARCSPTTAPTADSRSPSISIRNGRRRATSRAIGRRSAATGTTAAIST
ncbi:MAG: hypothetical protein ACFNUC_07890 [Selenomonas noxia]